jgi:hypothetical protein
MTRTRHATLTRVSLGWVPFLVEWDGIGGWMASVPEFWFVPCCYRRRASPESKGWLERVDRSKLTMNRFQCMGNKLPVAAPLVGSLACRFRICTLKKRWDRASCCGATQESEPRRGSRSEPGSVEKVIVMGSQKCLLLGGSFGTLDGFLKGGYPEYVVSGVLRRNQS